MFSIEPNQLIFSIKSCLYLPGVQYPEEMKTYFEYLSLHLEVSPPPRELLCANIGLCL